MDKFVISLPKGKKRSSDRLVGGKSIANYRLRGNELKQMAIDFGQSALGKRQSCPDCGLLFVIGKRTRSLML